MTQKIKQVIEYLYERAKAGRPLSPEHQAHLARVLAAELDELSLPQLPALEKKVGIMERPGERTYVDPKVGAKRGRKVNRPDDAAYHEGPQSDNPYPWGGETEGSHGYLKDWSTKKKVIVSIIIILALMFVYSMFGGNGGEEGAGISQKFLDLF